MRARWRDRFREGEAEGGGEYEEDGEGWEHTWKHGLRERSGWHKCLDVRRGRVW